MIESRKTPFINKFFLNKFEDYKSKAVYIQEIFKVNYKKDVENNK